MWTLFCLVMLLLLFLLAGFFAVAYLTSPAYRNRNNDGDSNERVVACMCCNDTSFEACDMGSDECDCAIDYDEGVFDFEVTENNDIAESTSYEDLLAEEIVDAVVETVTSSEEEEEVTVEAAETEVEVLDTSLPSQKKIDIVENFSAQSINRVAEEDTSEGTRKAASSYSYDYGSSDSSDSSDSSSSSSDD